MRNALILVGGLAFAVAVVASATGLRNPWRFASGFVSHSVWASDDINAKKQILPKEVRKYLEDHPSGEQSASTEQISESLQPTDIETLRCSAADVIDTIKSLSGGSDNPAAALFIKMAKLTLSLDAIRTVSSSPSQTLCEARLTIKTEMSRPEHDPQNGTRPPETPEEKALNDKLYEQLATKVEEIAYKVEKTDDGQTYVTLIPSNAQILDQQNRQRRYQEQEFQQELEDRAAGQRSIDRQEQYENSLEERWRQHD